MLGDTFLLSIFNVFPILQISDVFVYRGHTETPPSSHTMSCLRHLKVPWPLCLVPLWRGSARVHEVMHRFTPCLHSPSPCPFSDHLSVSFWVCCLFLFCNNAKCPLVSMSFRVGKPQGYMEKVIHVSRRMGVSGKVFMWKEASNSPRRLLGVGWLYSCGLGPGSLLALAADLLELWKRFSCLDGAGGLASWSVSFSGPNCCFQLITPDGRTSLKGQK